MVRLDGGVRATIARASSFSSIANAIQELRDAAAPSRPLDVGGRESGLTRIRLAQTSIDGPALGLGCSRLGSTSISADHEQQRRFLEDAYASGVNLFDSANIYGQGDSERLLGSVFAARRDKVILMTKAGQRYTRSQKAAIAFKRPLRLIANRIPALRARILARRAASLPRCFEPDYLRRELDGSLARLKTSYVDVFFLHSPSVDDLSDDRLGSMMAALKIDGRARSWGISCDGRVRIAALLGKTDPDVLQIPYSAVDDFDNRAALRRFTAGGGTVVVREVLKAVVSESVASSVRTGPVVRARWAAVAKDDCVSAALCGTGNISHLREAAAVLSDPAHHARVESLS